MDEKKVLTLAISTALVLIIGSFLFYYFWKLLYVPESRSHEGVVITPCQKGNITYLLFKPEGDYGGITVVNYTTDSMEYELLKSSTKTKDCEEDTSHSQ